jgi:hypothetical protein
MKSKRLFLTLVFAFIFSAGAFVSSSQAQVRTVRTVVVYRPVYVRPYWGYRHYYYDPFWADLYKTPYERYLEERYYAQRELQGDLRELAKHREKYGRDGMLTEKERRELADDVRDVAKARERLARLNRYY